MPSAELSRPTSGEANISCGKERAGIECISKGREGCLREGAERETGFVRREDGRGDTEGERVVSQREIVRGEKEGLLGKVGEKGSEIARCDTHPEGRKQSARG